MPDPKDFMDDDHTYVKGHVRRKPNRIQINGDSPISDFSSGKKASFIEVVVVYGLLGLLGIIILSIIGYVVWLFAHHSWLWALLSFAIVGIPLIIWYVFKIIKAVRGM